MIALLELAAWLLACIALGASVYIVAFALRGVELGIPADEPLSKAPEARIVVLIPAHNEQHGIGQAVDSVRNAGYPPSLLRCIVIADNCADETAAQARVHGAECWVRSDNTQRGKGQALAWAIASLELNSFDMLVIVDADSLLSPGFFDQLAFAWQQDHKRGHTCVYQSRYDFLPASSGAAFDSLSVASKAAENSFIYRPRSHAGLVLLLQGNGIAMPAAALEQVPFGASSIVEDAEYAIALAVAGVPVRFVERARLHTRMTATVRDAAPQRLRWASGIFQLIGKSAPRLLRQAMVQWRWRLAEAVVMLLCTSRVLVAALGAASVSLAIVVAALHGSEGLLFCSMLVVALQLLYFVLILRAAPGGGMSAGQLWKAPFYVAFVVMVQLAALAGVRKGRWARTVR